MSSGAMIIAPGAVVFAAGAVAVLVVAGAAVLAVRAANAATEAGLRAIVDYGEQLEKLANEQYDAALQSMVWESISADVVELNARIRMLAERARRSGAVVAVPKPLSLAGVSAAEAAAWTMRASEELRSAQETMLAAVSADQGPAIAASLPKSVAAQPNTAAALARYQATLGERYARQAPEPGPRIDPASAVAAALHTLDVDANEREHANVLAAAALVTTDDARAAGGYLRTLKAKIADVNKAVARRRLAAQWLSALEEPIVTGVDLPEPFQGTAAKLRAVVAGDEDMDVALRAEAAKAVDWAADVTRRHYVDSVLHECLADLGFTVQQDFDLEHSTEVQVTRSAWHDEHTAQIWMDREGALRGRLVRQYAQDGDDAAMRDRSRCAEFNGALVELGSRLRVDVRTTQDDVLQIAGAAAPVWHAATEPEYRHHDPS